MVPFLTGVVASIVAATTPTVDLARSIPGGGVDTFDVVAGASDLVRGTVDQGEHDLIIVVADAHGMMVGTIDARERGREVVAFRALEAGTYHVSVRVVASGRRASSYRAHLQVVPYDDRDGPLLEAVTLATAARQAFKKADGASLRESVSLRRTALPLWRAADEREMVLATLSGIGDALYRLGDYTGSKSTYEEALTLSGQLGDRAATAELTNNLGMTAWRLGDVLGAERLLNHALAAWRAMGARQGEAIALGNRGILFRQSGRYDEARRDHARALEIHRRLGNRRSEAVALNNMALVLDALGRPREALRSLAAAVALYRQAGDGRAEGRARIAMARTELALGRRAVARTHTQQGLALVETAGDMRAAAEGVNQLGRIRSAIGDLAGARSEHQRALELYRAVQHPRGESDALHDLAVSCLAGGDGASAIPYFDLALGLREALSTRGLVVETLAGRAAAHRLAGSLDAARQDVEHALRLAEDMRSGVFERELRTSYAAAMQSYYGLYVDILADLHRRHPDAGFDGQAFEVADRAKARGLLERMRESTKTQSMRVSPVLARRQEELNAAMDYWSGQLWDRAEQRGSATDDIVGHLDELARALDLTEAEIRRASPELRQLWQPHDVSLADIRRYALDTRTVLVAFSLGESRSHVWAVTTSRIAMAALPGRRAIEIIARRLHASLSAGPADAASSDAIVRDAASLGRLLFAPIEARLAGKRILIVADGALHLVPFGLLTLPGGRELIAGAELISAPSAMLVETLDTRDRSRTRAPRPLVALGDPVFDVHDPRVEGVTHLSAASAQPARARRLPFSGDEVDRIMMMAPAGSVRVLGFDSNRAFVTSGALADFRVVHLATHAYRNDRHPDATAIVLSLVDPRGTTRNGLLRLGDIYALRLHADLVVLSACDTGTGRLLRGDGLTSLAHGFLSAGASRVLASLWKVDDEATAALMEDFYRRFLSGTVSPAAALAQAQLDLRRQPRWRHPYYWSGWTLNGLP